MLSTEDMTITGVVVPKQKTLKDALVFAAKNREFGELLMKNPEKMRVEYNLTDAQIEQIKSLRNKTIAAGSMPAVQNGIYVD